MMNVKRLTTLALYTSIALAIHVLESLVPLPVPIPGVKLGLANIVTLFMLFAPAQLRVRQKEAGKTERKEETAKAEQQGEKNKTGQLEEKNAAAQQENNKTRAADVLAVLLGRILLGAFIAGRPIMLVYSLAGGLLAITAQLITRRFVTDKQAWVCGAAGGMFHNIGQITAAVIITGTPGIITYLPMLIMSGIFTGALTGLIAGLAATRLSYGKTHT